MSIIDYIIYNISYVVTLIAGGVLGYYVGRWRAETGRAMFDMKRVWDRRTLYRDLDEF